MDRTATLSEADLLEYFQDSYPSPVVLPQRPVPMNLASIRAAWETFLRTSRFADAVGIHVHVPFCIRKCSFCDCSSDPLSGRAALAPVLDALDREADYLAPAFEGRTFCRLYVGGGTPNLLSPAELRRLLDGVDRRFPTRPGAVRCIEFAPELARPGHLEVAGAAGINRLSMGVQSLDGAVLKAAGRRRAASRPVERTFAGAREAGIREINLDLIFGLPGETEETFHAGLLHLLDLGPETITIQLVHDSEQATVFRSEGHRREVEDRYVRYVRERLLDLPATRPDYACRVRPGTCVLVRRSLARPWDQWLDYWSFRDRVHVSTLGLGAYAHSRLHGMLEYQLQAAAFDPAAPLYVHHRLSEELEGVIDAACGLVVEGRFDLDAILRRYGQVPRLAARVEALAAGGALRRDGAVYSCPPGPVNPLLALVRELAEEGRQAALAMEHSRR